MTKNNNKSKHLASISLAIMGTGFIATIPFQDSLFGRFLQGGFEAGLVGGLADWFAVTALFRHPLGIPIPHTALLPKNRQRITNGIVNMLENDWLTKESIRAKIKNMNFTEKALNIAEEKIQTEVFQTAITSILVHSVQELNVEKLSPFVEKELKSKLETVDTLKVLQAAVEQVTTREYEVKALDFALNELAVWASKDSTKFQLGTMAIEYIENMKMDGFMQIALRSFSNFINEEKLGSLLQTFILRNVRGLQEKDNRNRQMVIQQIQSELTKTQNLEKLSGELNGWKQQFIEDWQPANQITDILKQFKERLLLFIQAPEFFGDFVLPAIQKLLSNTKADSERMAKMEDWVQKQIANLVEKNHSVIGKLVRENLDKLDDATITQMVENNVGKDLQWIRVNGALCGFLIGLVLVGVKSFF
ncbi:MULTISPECIES: DUF445 domain-containing protein [unclassified Bacillus (in: firmicutes)]|uniref:DUF445 domain-containing protein n=1 Tax=unclassified Bacillus (in: firmicutes) TaxID=185979 RepID=UPI0008E0E18B|nr:MULTISPECIES: DUF445 domain-containing protein [unclassified Bacillus (in: firmicutes)]SFA80492.1 Uncharacterized membrane-anchored protein YjiN, DUF445 family [Bacillus sp. UNCCL13]SFQ70578.1 Uncharacterized membrane-anchored protein YjiN, DUF445 family [Bacillus sp. cl95]